MRRNWLKLNHIKMKCLDLGSLGLSDILSLTINGLLHFPRQSWFAFWGSSWICNCYGRSWWQLQLGESLHSYNCEPIVPIPGPGGLVHDHSCLGSSWLGCCNVLYMELPLKIIQELQLDQKAANLSVCTCYTFATQAALAPSSFPGTIQGTGYHI